MPSEWSAGNVGNSGAVMATCGCRAAVCEPGARVFFSVVSLVVQSPAAGKMLSRFLTTRLDLVDLLPALRLQIVTGTANAVMRACGLHNLREFMLGATSFARVGCGRTGRAPVYLWLLCVLLSVPCVERVYVYVCVRARCVACSGSSPAVAVGRRTLSRCHRGAASCAGDWHFPVPATRLG